MFILCVPIQLFLHLYFSNAVKNNSFNGIAGFDDKVKWNVGEVKKLLIQIDLHLGILSTVCIFLLGAVNGLNLKIQWFTEFLMVGYLLNFILTIELFNYKMIDKIYLKKDDQKRARRSILLTILCCFTFCLGIGLTVVIFEEKGIENNTLPALKTGGLLLLGIFSAGAGCLIDISKIKKWNPADGKDEPDKGTLAGFLISLIFYVLMWIG